MTRARWLVGFDPGEVHFGAALIDDHEGKIVAARYLQDRERDPNLWARSLRIARELADLVVLEDLFPRGVLAAKMPEGVRVVVGIETAAFAAATGRTKARPGMTSKSIEQLAAVRQAFAQIWLGVGESFHYGGRVSVYPVTPQQAKRALTSRGGAKKLGVTTCAVQQYPELEELARPLWKPGGEPTKRAETMADAVAIARAAAGLDVTRGLEAVGSGCV